MKREQILGEWLGNMKLSSPLTIAGPCSAETEQQVLAVAKELAKEQHKVNIFRAGVWKPRTRPGSFEGVGEKALPWLQRVKSEYGFPVAIEVANAAHVAQALKYDIDILWLGARTTVNPFTVQEIAEALAGTKKTILVKNPVNPDLSLWIGAFERLTQKNITNLGAIHRGFSTYDKTAYRNKPQWQIPIDLKAEMPHLPMICDPSHICGRRDTLEQVAQTALDLQFDGLMLETHIDPDNALSDNSQQLKPVDFLAMINRLVVRQENTKDECFHESLRVLRAEIDQIDEKLLALLSGRIQVANKIGKCKKEQNVAVLQNHRFSEIMNKMKTKAKELGLSERFVDEIFKAIHQESIRHQEKVVNS